MRRAALAISIAVGLTLPAAAAAGPDPFALYPGATIVFGRHPGLGTNAFRFMTAGHQELAWLLVGPPDPGHPYLETNIKVHEGYRKQGIATALYDEVLRQQGLAPIDNVFVDVNQRRFLDTAARLDGAPYRLWAAAEATPSFRSFRRFGYFVAESAGRGEVRLVSVDDPGLRSDLNRARRWMALATQEGKVRVPGDILGPYASESSYRIFRAPALMDLWEKQSLDIAEGMGPLSFTSPRTEGIPLFEFSHSALGTQQPFDYANDLTKMRQDLYPRTAELRLLVQESRELGVTRFARMLWLRDAVRAAE